jgi:hypothetical protein
VNDLKRESSPSLGGFARCFLSRDEIVECALRGEYAT